MRAQKLLNIFLKKRMDLLLASRGGGFGSSPLQGLRKCSHNTPLATHPSSVLALQGISVGGQTTCTAQLPSHPAFEEALAHSVGRDILGFTGISLMGLPTNT